MNCSMRGMPRVSTLSTWVSPRWKRPEPCAVGRISTSADERPDVGGAATVDAQALVDDAAADDLLLQRPERGLDLLGARRRTAAARRACRTARAAGPRGSRRGGCCARSCRRSTSPPTCWRWPARRPPRTRRRRSRSGSRRGCRRSGRASRMTAARSSFWSSIDAAIHCLASSRPSAMTSSVDLRRALFVEAPGGFGATGLDHHDGDVAALDHATGDDELEGGLGALLERRVRDPLAALTRQAHRADRAVERDARHGERGRRAVDRRDVVRVDRGRRP